MKFSAVGAGPDGPPGAIKTPVRNPAFGAVRPEMLPLPDSKEELTAAPIPSGLLVLLPVPTLRITEPVTLKVMDVAPAGRMIPSGSVPPALAATPD
jgi:hypothetical protein